MGKTITGFFRKQAEGQKAQDALLQAGFTRDQVSFLAGDTRGHETPRVGPPAEDVGSESQAGTDAWIGGAVGLAAGLIATVLPGIGALILAGPIAGAIGGLTLGATAGGIVGLLKDHGVSEEEADFYAEGVRRGGALVTAHAVPDNREKDVRKIFDDNGAIEIERLANEWRAEGWTGPEKTMRAS